MQNKAAVLTKKITFGMLRPSTNSAQGYEKVHLTRISEKDISKLYKLKCTFSMINFGEAKLAL